MMRYKYYFVFALLFLFLKSNSQNVATGNDVKKARLDSLMREEMNKMAKRKKDAIGKPFGYFTISSDGKKISNKDVAQKVVFINFWFAACTPCIEEFDELNALYEKFKSNKNFLFLSFSFDSPEIISKTSRKYQLKFTSYSIPEPECRKLNQGSGFPTNMLVGKDGRIKQFYDGRISKENIEAVYQDILKELNRGKALKRCLP